MVDVNRMTSKVQEALQQAGGLATRRNHQGIDVEHLLLGLLDQADGIAPRLLEATGVAPRAVREAVERELARRPQVSGPSGGPSQAYLTQRLNQLLGKAEDEMRALKDEYLSVEHLLIAMVAEGGAGPHFNIVGAADATPANKLTIGRTLVVAPLNSTDFTWFAPTAAMADFTRPAPGNNPDDNILLVDGGGATMASIHRAIPQILVNDLGAALSYYQERLGFTCDFAYEDFYASISRDGAVIHLKMPPKVEGGPGRFRSDEQLAAFLPVSGVQELHDEFVRRGARIVKPVEVHPWGQRDFHVEDPDGHVFEPVWMNADAMG